MQMIQRFVRDERGATAIEYALIASGVSIVIVGTVATLGSNVKTLFTSVSTALK
jgi:pilus assembly protein Flp/PilA